MASIWRRTDNDDGSITYSGLIPGMVVLFLLTAVGCSFLIGIIAILAITATALDWLI